MLSPGPGVASSPPNQITVSPLCFSVDGKLSKTSSLCSQCHRPVRAQLNTTTVVSRISWDFWSQMLGPSFHRLEASSCQAIIVISGQDNKVISSFMLPHVFYCPCLMFKSHVFMPNSPSLVNRDREVTCEEIRISHSTGPALVNIWWIDFQQKVPLEILLLLSTVGFFIICGRPTASEKEKT